MIYVGSGIMRHDATLDLCFLYPRWSEKWAVVLG